MPDPILVALILGFVVLNAAVIIGIIYLVRRWTSKSVPAPVQERGQANALICGVAVVAVLGLLVAGIWAIFNRSFASSAIIAFGVFWIFIFTAFVASWLHGKATSGSLLLDCGPHPQKKLFLLQAAFFLLFFGGGGLARFLTKSDVAGIANMLFGISVAIYWVMMSAGRVQVRENGIWQFWSLLKWNKIQSYEWQNDALLLQAKTRFPFLGKGAVQVPDEHKSSLDTFLIKHCTQQTDA